MDAVLTPATARMTLAYEVAPRDGLQNRGCRVESGPAEHLGGEMRRWKRTVAVVLFAFLAACNFGPMTPLPEEDGGMLIPAAADSLPR